MQISSMAQQIDQKGGRRLREPAAGEENATEAKFDKEVDAIMKNIQRSRRDGRSS